MIMFSQDDRSRQPEVSAIEMLQTLWLVSLHGANKKQNISPLIEFDF